MTDYQHNLSFATRTPLLDVDTVAWLTQMYSPNVINAVDEGRLAWAWNVGAADASRRDLRIWRGSVAMFLKSRGGDGGGNFDEMIVMLDLFPNRDLWTGELRRRFNLTKQLIQFWIEEDLVKVNAIAPRGGTLNGARKIDRASLVKFFQSRRVGFISSK